MIPIAHVLDQALKKMPAAKKIKGQMLIDAWPIAVGEMIAVKTEAFSFEQGTLVVKVRDSIWAQHLSLQKKQIIAQLNRQTKTRVLTDIRFQVGKVRTVQKVTPATTSALPWRQVELEPSELEAIETAFTQAILPPDLKDSMKAVFIAQKKKNKWAVGQGYPVCDQCGSPLIETARDVYCLSCRTEEIG